MFIDLDFFGLNEGATFKTRISHPNYYRLEAKNGIFDEIYVDENITIPYSIEKPSTWSYQTVLDCKLQGNLEGGSIQASGYTVKRIRFQKRKTDELEWQTVGEIEYEGTEKVLYEAIDKYIENDFEYQYSLIPLAETVIGNRVVSKEIVAEFEGIFISDKDNNYQLLYDAEFGAIEHITPSATHEPLGSQFPIVTYSDLDYQQGNIKALFLSTQTTESNKINIRVEKLNRDKLMKFIKNRKPKVLRSFNGETMVISIVGNPNVEHNNSVHGIATISFNYVQIGKLDDETLIANNLLAGLEGDY